VIINDQDLDWTEPLGPEAGFRRTQLGAAAGSEELGCSLYELDADGHSWPFHYHEGNEEAIYVCAGSGLLRTADGDQPLEEGDYVALPAGPDGAHRIRPAGDGTLRYLVVSTMVHPDVTVYPDTDAVGVFRGRPPGGSDDGGGGVSFFQDDDAVEFDEATDPADDG
jgi:uncharacterized cupin superfamily protein